MTPKKKATELKDKFYQVTPSQVSLGTERSLVIECAKIVVEEIMNELWNIGASQDYWKYWKEVKQELDKM